MGDLVRRTERAAAVVAAMALTISACSLTQPQSEPPPSPAGTPSPSPSPAALKITSATFHSGEVGVDYSAVTLNGVGGVTPYSWTVSAGSMPAGLTISTNGTVSGTPKAAGTFRFTLQLADAAGGNVKVVKSLGIARALKATLIPGCAVQCLVEVGCVSVCGKFGTLAGGIGPFTYSSLGNIPAGVHLNGLALAGTFTAGARYSTFTVNVTDSFGAHTSMSPTFNVFPHLTFTTGPCVVSVTGSCTAGLQYTVGVSETPSVKVVAWAGNKTCGAAAPVICPAPPFSANVQGGVVTINLGPTVYPNLSTGTFKLSLSDQFPCGPGVHCSATVTLTVDLR